MQEKTAHSKEWAVKVFYLVAQLPVASAVR